MDAYPDQTLILVLDNASIHHSAATRAALALFEHWGQCFWLPPYCSTLNLIERFWLHLQAQVCVDTLFPCLASLVAAAEQELTAQNDLTNPDRFSFLTLLP